MRTRLPGQPAPWGFVFWLTLLLLPSPGNAKPAFPIEDVKIRAVGEELVMDARFVPDLSPVALEALDNGVPLTLEAHIQVRETEAWVWDSSLVDRRLRYEIRYQPLAERYQVSPVPGGAGHNYVTRDAAIAALGDLHDLPLLNRGELAAGKDYRVDLKIALDIEELPLPLRPTAYLLPSWKLSSGWTTWPLRP